MKEIAEMANVGVGTVSRAINKSGYVSKEKLERIEKAIKESHYIPNQVARNLKENRTHFIALLIPTIYHPFFSQFTYYLETELYKMHYHLMVMNTQGIQNKEIALLDLMRQNQVDGFVFISNFNYGNSFDDIPMVSIDHHFSPNVPCITSDNYNGIKLACEHLKKKGCKTIGFIGGKTFIPSEVNNRIKAYRDFVSENNYHDFSFEDIYSHGDEDKLVEKFFDNFAGIHFDGMVAATDPLAFSICRYALSRHMRIPDDIKIVGFDGTEDSWSTVIKLTTIKQNTERMAQKVVETLMKLINHPDKKITKTFIIPVSFTQGTTT